MFPLIINPGTWVKTLSLPTVTLICTDCLEVERSTKVIDRCLELCDFGAVKFLTSLPTAYPHTVQIQSLPSLCDYSIFMLKRVHEYVDTPHFLTVQHDGFILNPNSWDPAWLGYDYMAPIFDQYDMVGSGGFSLRSKALMKAVSDALPPWDGTPDGTNQLQSQLGCYEDGAVSMHLRAPMEKQGFKYPAIPEANKFAQGGNRNPAHFVEKPFGFHRPAPERVIDYATGSLSGIL